MRRVVQAAVTLMMYDAGRRSGEAVRAVAKGSGFIPPWGEIDATTIQTHGDCDSECKRLLTLGSDRRSLLRMLSLQAIRRRLVQHYRKWSPSRRRGGYYRR